MKKYIAILGFAWFAILSCSHEPTEPETPENNVHEWQDSVINGDATMSSMAILFSVDNDMTVRQEGTTRATTTIGGTCTFEVGDLVAVAVKGDGTLRSTTEVIKLYRIASDGTSLEYAGGDDKPFTWNTSTEQISVRAWSYGTSTQIAHTLDAPESFDYSLETDQNTNGYRELMYCKATDKTYGNIILTFYHQLSRVVFNVSHDRSGTLNVTSPIVGNTTSFPVTARFSVPTGSSNVGSWATRSTYNTITPKTETTQAGYQKTYSVVVFPKTYAQNSHFFTINNIDGNYVYSVSDVGGVSLSAGNQYNYTITVKDIKDIRKNPLYYMAEYRLAQDGVSFDAAPGWGVTFMRTYNNVMSLGYSYTTSKYDGYAVPSTPKKIGGVAYHVPTKLEWFSICPLDWLNGSQYLYQSGATTSEGVSVPAGVIRNENCTFGYSNATKYRNGSNNSDATGVTYQSYWSSVYGSAPFATWGKNTTDATRYAVRFIGTEFCSVWRYKQTGTPGAQNSTGRRMIISSRLIDPISSSDLTALSAKISEIVSAPESYWTDATWGAVMRTIYWGGHTSDGNGRNYAVNYNGHHASASGNYFNLACTATSADVAVSSPTTFGMDLTLFRDE